MNLRRTFFNHRGRIGRRDYWTGAGTLLIAGFVLGAIPLIGNLASFALMVPWLYLSVQRLQDMGQSRRYVFVPLVAFVLASLVVAIGSSAVTGLGFAVLISGIAFVVSIAFLVWVGAMPSNPSVSRFGPPAEGAA